MAKRFVNSDSDIDITVNSFLVLFPLIAGCAVLDTKRQI